MIFLSLCKLFSIDLAQDCGISCVLAMEILQSRTKPYIINIGE